MRERHPINKKYTVEELRTIMATEGYVLLSKEYINRYFKLKIQCPRGHIYSTTRPCWQKGCRCPKCHELSNFGPGSSAWKGGVVARNIPIYDTYHHKISYCELTRRCPEEPALLQVQCRKCKAWFTPTRYQVENRICALERNPSHSGAENNFYCSTECKQKCPVYRKIRHIASKPKNQNVVYTNQELRIWSLEVRCRADYKCEICHEPATEAHHILPKKSNGFFALDPDNGVALCKHCHHHVVHTGQCSALEIAASPCAS